MTKPTRSQEQGCDLLAEALLSLTEGARRDPRSSFDVADLREVVGRLAKAASAFTPDEIVARALERRGRGLGLRAGTAELLTLMEGAVPPSEMLLLSDEEFRSLVDQMEQELGEV